MADRFERNCRRVCLCVIIAISIFLLAIFSFLIATYFILDIYVYRPNWPDNSRNYVYNPLRYNLSYEEVVLKTTDSVKLHAYFIKHKNSSANTTNTILCFHGNDGNIGHRIKSMKNMFDTCGCNLFLVDYRGYGLSHGEPSEMGFYIDAEAALGYLKSRLDINTNRIIVYGESLGGAVAIHVSMQHLHELFGLLVVNTFTSVPELFRLAKWYFSVLPDEVFKSHFRNTDKIKSITIPTLFVSSRYDTVVPPFMMDSLFDNFSGMLRYKMSIEHGMHIKIWQHKGLVEYICKFINEIDELQFMTYKEQKTTYWSIQ